METTKLQQFYFTTKCSVFNVWAKDRTEAFDKAKKILPNSKSLKAVN